MKILINRLRNGSATTPDLLKENVYSFGRLAPAKAFCGKCGKCSTLCPAGAIASRETGVEIDYGRCIFCMECVRLCPEGALNNTHDFGLGGLTRGELLERYDVEELGTDQTRLSDEEGARLKEAIYRKFNRSLVLREVDAGSCNACESELSALSNAYYDLARFGVRFAASPRHADGIVVTGPVAINMREGLVKTYQALSEPRLVIAAGSCAISGGIFRDNYAVYNGVANILPVDLFIPGCPPSPAAIAYAIFKLMGRL